MTKDPLCEECLKAGKETPAVLVHHIDSDELNNRHDNHSSVCTDCHEAIHKSERWGKK
jgi:5-methylcytosine-specific restriction protein A